MSATRCITAIDLAAAIAAKYGLDEDEVINILKCNFLSEKGAVCHYCRAVQDNDDSGDLDFWVCNCSVCKSNSIPITGCLKCGPENFICEVVEEGDMMSIYCAYNSIIGAGKYKNINRYQIQFTITQLLEINQKYNFLKIKKSKPGKRSYNFAEI